MKKHVRTSITIFLAVAITLCFTSSVFAKNIGSIILKSGFKYENVEYAIFKNKKRVRFWLNSKMSALKFREILTILNQDGTEAFPQVFTDYQGTVKRVRIFKNKIPLVYEKKKWKVAVKLGGIYGVQSGRYYQNISKGLGIEGEIKFAKNNKRAFKFILSSYVTDKVEDNNPAIFVPDVTLEYISLTLTVQKILIAVENLAYKDIDDPMSSISYYSLAMGAVIHKKTLRVKYYDLLQGKSLDESESGHDTRFAFSFSGGYISKIKNNLGIDFSGSIDFILDKRINENIPSTAKLVGNILNAKIGLIYFFGTD